MVNSLILVEGMEKSSGKRLCLHLPWGFQDVKAFDLGHCILIIRGTPQGPKSVCHILLRLPVS